LSDKHPHTVMETYFSDKLAKFYTVVKESSIRLSDYAAPCLPYVGNAFSKDGSPRILFVGKATKGWGRLEEAIDGKRTAADWLGDSEIFILERVLPFYGRLQPGAAGYYQSSFWRRIYSLTCRVMLSQADSSYEREAHRAQGCFEAIAWTNLFKIGTYVGNPDTRMRELLLAHLNTLPDEIEMLQPHIVIFSTGSTYDDFLFRSLGTTVEHPSDRVSVVSGLPDASCALRTPHFQSCTTGEFDGLCRTVFRLAGLDSLSS